MSNNKVVKESSSWPPLHPGNVDPVAPADCTRLADLAFKSAMLLVARCEKGGSDGLDHLKGYLNIMEKYKQWASEAHPSEAVHGMDLVDDSDESDDDRALSMETPGDTKVIFEQAADAAAAVEVIPFDFSNWVAGRGWAGWAASFLW